MSKIRNNQSGFGFVGVLLVVAVISILGLIGWYVTNSNQTKSPTQGTAKEQTKEAVVYNDFVADNIVAPYVLPSGWSRLNCGNDTVYLFVPTEKAGTDCKGQFNQPENPESPDFTFLGVYVRNTSYLDTQSCAKTLTIREGSNSQYPADEYACQDVTIGGKKGLRQTGTHTAKSAQVLGIPSVEIFYDFQIADGRMFEASYTHYTKSSSPDLTKQFDDFVKSLKFD